MPPSVSRTTSGSFALSASSSVVAAKGCVHAARYAPLLYAANTANTATGRWRASGRHPGVEWPRAWGRATLAAAAISGNGRHGGGAIRGIVAVGHATGDSRA